MAVSRQGVGSHSTIRVLHVDDEPNVVDVTADYLERVIEGFEVLTETDPAAALDRLEELDVDCIVSDYQMPSRDGLEFLADVRARHPDLPFILYTGQGSEEIASDAISAGVTDYLQKEGGTDQYQVLATRIEQAVERRRAEDRAASFLESAPDGIVIVAVDGTITETNAQLRATFGYDAGELVGQPIEVLIPPGERDAHVSYREEYVTNPERRPMGADLDLHGLRKDGTEVPVDISLSPMAVGERLEIMAAVRDLTERQRLRDRAAHESQLTERILDTSPIGIIVRDAADGTMTRINQRAREILPTLGGEGDAPPLASWDVRDADDEPVDPDVRLFDQVIETGEPLRNEVLSIRHGNGRRWLRTNAAPLGENGTEAVVYAFEDITEQIELERERQERLGRITDAFLALDPDWEITYANEKAATLLERERSALIGENVWEQFPEAVETRFFSAYEEAMSTQTPVDFEEYFEPLETWFAVRAYPSETGLTLYFRDITEQKERERRYDAIFNKTFQFTGLMQPDGTLIEANDTALAFGGIDRADVIGRKVWDTHWFQHGDAAEYAREAVSCARDGELYREEIDVQGADRIATIDFSVKPVFDERGAVDLLVPEGRDITELKERERQLRRQNERLDEFASVVSHDLRNPLNTATGAVELLRQTGEDQYLEKVDESLDRMAELVEDLLMLARKGQVVSEPAAVSLERVAGDAWATVETDRARLAVTDGTVTADASRLRELLENLFRNAVEHGGDDVTVTVEPIADGGFAVADDGPGIPDADRTAVFEPGFTSTDGDAGFGLAIVRTIAHAHDWEIAVTESDNGGARFEIGPRVTRPASDA